MEVNGKPINIQCINYILNEMFENDNSYDNMFTSLPYNVIIQYDNNYITITNVDYSFNYIIKFTSKDSFIAQNINQVVLGNTYKFERMTKNESSKELSQRIVNLYKLTLYNNSTDYTNAEDSDTYAEITYTVWDMDNDGIPELIITGGTCSADMKTDFYTCNKKATKVYSCINANQGSSNLFYYNKNHSLIEVYYKQDYARLDFFSKKGRSINVNSKNVYIGHKSAEKTTYTSDDFKYYDMDMLLDEFDSNILSVNKNLPVGTLLTGRVKIYDISSSAYFSNLNDWANAVRISSPDDEDNYIHGLVAVLNNDVRDSVANIKKDNVITVYMEYIGIDCFERPEFILYGIE